MQRRNFVTTLAVVLAGWMSKSALPATAIDTKESAQTSPPPSTYRFSLILMADTKPLEFILVLNNLGFKSLSAPALRRYVANFPKGSTIEWAPSDLRIGGEPTDKEVGEFGAFARAHGIKFVVIPAG